MQNLTNAVNEYSSVFVRWDGDKLHFCGHVEVSEGKIEKDIRDINITRDAYLQFVHEVKTTKLPYMAIPKEGGLYITHTDNTNKECKNPNNYSGKVRRVTCAVCGMPFTVNNRTEDDRLFIVCGREVALCHIHRPLRVERIVYEYIQAIRNLPKNTALSINENASILYKIKYYTKSRKMDICYNTINGICFAYHKADMEGLKGDIC